MKGFAALALIAGPCVAELINDPERIARLNAEPDSLWSAAPHDIFEGMTVNDARVRLGAILSHIDNHLNSTRPDSYYTALPNDKVPEAFDSRDHWKGLIHPIRDQKQCGSCWAFSSSEVLSDRVAIATGKPSPVLSAEDLVSCDHKDSGCNGGELPLAWKYLTTTGLVTDACMPYGAGGGKAPTCPTKCVDGEDFTRVKAKSSYAIKGPQHMAKDIMMHGPIQVGFMVYPSFMSYSAGIYSKHKSEKQSEGGHAVKIVGWGADANGHNKYWVVANSWGPAWGEEGFFRIKRGNNECGIEKMGPPYAGLADAGEEDLIVV